MTVSGASAIDAVEYDLRQRCFAETLRASGLEGAVVFSRGGSTLDRYANVFYLTGHYQSYSYLPDSPGLFSGRAHTALVISADGNTILCLSAPEYDVQSVRAGEIRCSGDFIETVAGAIRDLRLGIQRLGLIGADVVPARYWRQLAAKVSPVEWIDCDENLEALRRIKSSGEQAIIRRVAEIHRRGTSALLKAVDAGRTEAELVATLAESVLSEGCGIYFTAMSSGEKIGQYTSAPLPGFTTRKLERGDLLRFDVGIVGDGYLSDYGRTVVVGPASASQTHLLDTLHHALDVAIDAVRPGATVHEVVMAGEKALKDAGVIANDDGTGRIVSSFRPRPWLGTSLDD